nr:MAG TPA: hypothetical protein [Bacteriophage sp.]
MSELNFKNIKVDKDVNTLNLEALVERQSSTTPTLSKWNPNERAKHPFKKYTEYVAPIDEHSDADLYMDTLDFDNDIDIEEATNEVYIEACTRYRANDIDADIMREVALDLGFEEAICDRIAEFWEYQKAELEEDEFEDSIYDDVDDEGIDDVLDESEEQSEDLDNLKESTLDGVYDDEVRDTDEFYGNIYHSVAKAFDIYLEDHAEFDDLSEDDKEGIISAVAESYYMNLDTVDNTIISEELNKPHFFDDAFEYYLANAYDLKLHKLDYSIPEEALEDLEERSLYQYKNDIWGYVIKAQGKYLAWDSANDDYEWSDNLDDAEFFTNEDDAEELAKDYAEEAIIIPIRVDEAYELDEALKSNKIVSKLLNESRMADVDIVCEEFVHKHPGIKGELSVRLAHQLKQELVDILHINPNLAYEIAETYLEERYGEL